MQLLPADEWEARALCRRHDPEDYYPVDGTGRSDAAAQRVVAARCNRWCPVRDQCALRIIILEWGQSKGTRHGVWGGMTPQDRLRKEAELKAAGWNPEKQR